VVFLTRRGHTEAQILGALREAEGGTTGVDVCRQVGISEQTFYAWKRKYAGLGLSELRKLRQLREENAKLKRLVADLWLDRQMLQEIVRKKLYGLGTGVCWHAGRKRSIRAVSAGSRCCCRWRKLPYSIGVAVIRWRCCACGCESWRRAEYASGIGDSRCC
jgi:putative transposase